MMAVCGINCVECPCYKATLSSDIEGLGKIAKDWSGGENQYEAKDMVCLGCSPNNEVLFTWCRSCGVLACASEKGMPNCAVCDDFSSCAKIAARLQHMETSGSKIPAMMKLMNEKVRVYREEVAATKSCGRCKGK